MEYEVTHGQIRIIFYGFYNSTIKKTLHGTFAWLMKNHNLKAKIIYEVFLATCFPAKKMFQSGTHLIQTLCNISLDGLDKNVNKGYHFKID